MAKCLRRWQPEWERCCQPEHRVRDPRRPLREPGQRLAEPRPKLADQDFGAPPIRLDAPGAEPADRLDPDPVAPSRVLEAGEGRRELAADPVQGVAHRPAEVFRRDVVDRQPERSRPGQDRRPHHHQADPGRPGEPAGGVADNPPEDGPAEWPERALPWGTKRCRWRRRRSAQLHRRPGRPATATPRCSPRCRTRSTRPERPGTS